VIEWKAGNHTQHGVQAEPFSQAPKMTNNVTLPHSSHLTRAKRAQRFVGHLPVVCFAELRSTRRGVVRAEFGSQALLAGFPCTSAG